VKGGGLAGGGVPLMPAAWMRFWLLPSCVSCVLLCPSLLLLLLLCCILLLLVDLLQVMWGPSRHLGSLTAANWVHFNLNVSYSPCWGYSLCENAWVLCDDIKSRLDMYVNVPICEYMYLFIVGLICTDRTGRVCANSGKGQSARTRTYLIFSSL